MGMIRKRLPSLNLKITEELKLCINNRIPLKVIYAINNIPPNLIYTNILNTNLSVYRQLKRENIDEAM